MERVGTGASGRPRSVGFKRWGRRQPVERSGSEGIGMKAARHKEVVVSSCGEGRQSPRGIISAPKGTNTGKEPRGSPGLQAHPRVSPSWEQGADKTVLHTQREHCTRPKPQGIGRLA